METIHNKSIYIFVKPFYRVVCAGVRVSIPGHAQHESRGGNSQLQILLESCWEKIGKKIYNHVYFNYLNTIGWTGALIIWSETRYCTLYVGLNKGFQDMLKIHEVVQIRIKYTVHCRLSDVHSVYTVHVHEGSCIFVFELVFSPFSVSLNAELAHAMQGPRIWLRSS